MSDTPPRVPLRDIFRVFFTIGASSFGGGVTGWMHRITVGQRGWLTNEKFLAGLALGQVLPGANVSNMAVYIGQVLRGPLGAVVALGAVLGLKLLPRRPNSTSFSRLSATTRSASSRWCVLPLAWVSRRPRTRSRALLPR